MNWGVSIAEQLDFYWRAHLWPRLSGLSDDEYLWEPTPGGWSIRPSEDGRWQLDDVPVEPLAPPVTSIAWRIVHVGRDVLGKRSRAFFGDGRFPDGSRAPDDTDMFDARWWPDPLPVTAEDALAFLLGAYTSWREGVAGLDDEAMMRPLGSRGAAYADTRLVDLVMHVNREVIAHGAEICLLRDLYRANRDHSDPLVSAALRGDAPEVSRLLESGVDASAVRGSLVAEVAGLRHWDAVLTLIEHGCSVTGGDPSALHFAAAAGESTVAEALLERGADTTLVDGRFGLTPAGWAQYFGHAQMVARLAPGQG